MTTTLTKTVPHAPLPARVDPPATARPAAPVAAPASSLGRTVVDGALWTVLTALVNKGVTFAGQLALAWYLFPEDFGLVALAGSITAFSALLSAAGLQAVLVQQQERFNDLAGPTFWLALVLHGTAGLLVAGLAPLAGTLYGEPRVVPLILLASCSIPLSALTYVYCARLYIELRFRTITAIHVGEGLLQTGGAVLLAVAGFGPYALLVPVLLVRVYAVVVARLAAGPVSLGRPEPSRWPALLRPGLCLMANSFLTGLQLHGVVFVAALVHGPHTTGLFSWSYHIASQAVFLLMINLQQVLFPTLRKLNAERERQCAAVARAARVMLAVAVLVCLLQAALAGPLITLVFGERWAAAVPAVVWLSLGLVLTPLHVLASSVLLGQGRNFTAAVLTLAQTVLVLAAAAVGAVTGDHVAVSAGVAFAFLVGHMLAFGVAWNLLRGRLAARRLEASYT